MSKYLSFFTIQAKSAFGNKANLTGSLILLLIVVFIYNQLWVVIGKESATANLNQNFIWYLLMGELIIISTPRIATIIEDDIKSGTFAYYINKPISFFFMRFAEGVSSMSVSFFFMAFWGSLAVLFLTRGTPFTWYNFPIIMLAVYIGAIIKILMLTALGFSALWIQNIKTTVMAFDRLAFILGGAIFPLTIYPEWFISIAKFTPFYSMYYLSIKLVYDFSWVNLGITLALNAFWVVIMGSFIAYAYKKLSKRIDINGG